MDAASQYSRASITTQSNTELIVTLYEGAIQFLRTAKRKLEEEDYALKGAYIAKARDIVSELNNCLDLEAAPEIADSLRAIYNFIYRTLNEANIERSTDKIETCIQILTELLEAWQEVAKCVHSGGGPGEASDAGNGFTA